VKHVPVIEVRIWGQRVGAVALDPRLAYYVFAYEPAWRRTGMELAPLTMPLDDGRGTFVFPNLPEASFLRLPGMLADALPDDFGNALIDAWMAEHGIVKSEVTPWTGWPIWENAGWRAGVQAGAWLLERERRSPGNEIPRGKRAKADRGRSFGGRPSQGGAR